jgi:hypothetical protein
MLNSCWWNVLCDFRSIKQINATIFSTILNCQWRTWTINWRQIVKLSRYTPLRRFGGEEVYLLHIHDLGTRWGWVVSVTPRPRFTTGTHCTGGWVGHRAGLDTEDRGKILCPCRGSNPDRPVVQPVVRHYTAWATRLLKTNFADNLRAGSVLYYFQETGDAQCWCEDYCIPVVFNPYLFIYLFIYLFVIRPYIPVMYNLFMIYLETQLTG